MRHVALGLGVLPALLEPRRRALWREMRAYVKELPAVLGRPLPEAVAAQTPATPDLALPAASVRRLADAAALWERRSPVGLCLRRSLLRYHFLRRAGLPLVINFGARFAGSVADRDVAGHAWVTLHGRPYHEEGENWQGFAVMMRYPAE